MFKKKLSGFSNGAGGRGPLVRLTPHTTCCFLFSGRILDHGHRSGHHGNIQVCSFQQSVHAFPVPENRKKEMSLSAVCIQEAVNDNFKHPAPLAVIQIYRHLQLVYEFNNYPVPVAFAGVREELRKQLKPAQKTPTYAERHKLVRQLHREHPVLIRWAAFPHWRLIDYLEIEQRQVTYLLVLQLRKAVREVHVKNHHEIPVPTAQYILTHPQQLADLFKHLFDDAKLDRAIQDVRKAFADEQARNYYLLFLQSCPNPPSNTTH